ncbi:hypothetical protein [Microvirga lotononidis]|uniref:Uncharacterized protein n=1 Tax=Microvirga lotononidis TaxID=864069 RepID=I4YXY4_9HYPH|nr:hypothetical protein [Microvirga lotononidis]EIM28826.1 hypothetical protein MicloDRAFT_00024700 [Microvirga lotononidis]WQO25446.1 hypothetical protein U0023_11995 [Microvirga lotononidis]
MRAPLILFVAAVGLSTPCFAQNPCPEEPASTAATTPDPNSQASGTSPGTAGSSGWTGGLGGSYIGTTPKGPTPQSPSDHPATASGLDPMKNAATPTAGPSGGCTPSR